MSEEEWIGECAAILRAEPFSWGEAEATSYADALYSNNSFSGEEMDPEDAIEEDRQYWG